MAVRAFDWQGGPQAAAARDRREFWCGLLSGLVIGTITAVIAYFYYRTRPEGGTAVQAMGLGLIVFTAAREPHGSERDGGGSAVCDEAPGF